MFLRVLNRAFDWKERVVSRIRIFQKCNPCIVRMRHSIYKQHLAPCFDSITQSERGRNLKRTSVILKRQFRRSRGPFQRLNSLAARSAVEWDREYANSVYLKRVREFGSF